ncbi:Cytochrome P450 [Popillia japonica]|uniref:Cytochrome P450 n=1 Tax=Popillia japonica TaxID=7064 RepID=A0AAW1HSC9_POPJA
MHFLDRALSESLRLHPPAIFMSKVCTNAYMLPPCTDSNNKVKIEEGTTIIIPVYALHRDGNYFPNPETYNPDRFLDSNKSDIVKGSYLPFGEGPRTCIGMKFAILQVKIATISIIQNFDVRVNKKTKEPLEIDPNFFLLLAKGGLWLDFHKRNQ